MPNNKSDGELTAEKKDDLWSRIKQFAEEEDISYLDAAEKCVREYWKDKGLTKQIQWEKRVDGSGKDS